MFSCLRTVNADLPFHSPHRSQTLVDLLRSWCATGTANPPPETWLWKDSFIPFAFNHYQVLVWAWPTLVPCTCSLSVPIEQLPCVDGVSVASFGEHQLLKGLFWVFLLLSSFASSSVFAQRHRFRPNTQLLNCSLFIIASIQKLALHRSLILLRSLSSFFSNGSECRLCCDWTAGLFRKQ